MSGTLGGRTNLASRTAPVAIPRVAPAPASSPSGWVELAPVPFSGAFAPAPLAAVPTSAGNWLVGLGESSSNPHVYEYDLVTDAYTAITDAPTAAGRALGLVGSNSYFLGYGSSAGKIAAYWWDGGSWHTGSDHVHAGSGFIGSTAVVIGSSIYVLVGGTNEFLRYDPGGDTWTTLAYPSNPDTGYDNPLADIGGGQLLLFSQDSTDVYTIGSDSWDAGTTRQPRNSGYSSGAPAVVDGKVYLAGGYHEPGFGTLNVLNIYDVAGDTWTGGPNMASVIPSPTGGQLPGGDRALYVFGLGDATSSYAGYARKYLIG